MNSLFYKEGNVVESHDIDTILSEEGDAFKSFINQRSSTRLLFGVTHAFNTFVREQATSAFVMFDRES